MSTSSANSAGFVPASKRMADYLQGELESHSCPICYEAMEPPEHVSHFLLPENYSSIDIIQLHY